MIRPDQLTVIVPTRNEERNIPRLLASLPDSIQLVVVDSSTDDTCGRILELRAQRTVVVRADVNIPTARQLGADHARTPWLLFTDADVEFEPAYFDRLHRLDIDRQVAGIVGAKGTAYGYERYHDWFRTGQSLLDRMGIPAASGSNMLVRAESLEAVGGFDPELTVNEDSDLMFRVKRSGREVRFAPELQVRSFDHRRLERSATLKTAHSLSRCALLWAAPGNRLVRRSDWGYWRPGAVAGATAGSIR